MSKDASAPREAVTFYASQRLADLTRQAARQIDQTTSSYIRSALLRALRADGIDPIAQPEGK